MPKPNEIVKFDRGGINLSINRTKLKSCHVNALNRLFASMSSRQEVWSSERERDVGNAVHSVIWGHRHYRDWVIVEV